RRSVGRAGLKGEKALAHPGAPDGLTRRDLLRKSVAAAAAAPAMTALVANARAAPATAAPAPELEEVTVAQLQTQMASGGLTAQALVQKYQARITVIDPGLNSIIELNPDAEALAKALDEERRAGHVRGPLHGIPVLLKDNVDTHDKMQTAAGSIALVGTAPSQDSTVAAKLRAAGAVILGKTNLSEWANFRSLHSSSGWCGRGGQCNNPYALDRNPCGSSSGSGAAPSANLAAVSIGTETDGSIVCPANANGVVGIKPTVGLVSRAGVIPISHSQDTVGPHTRTVADAAAVLGAIASKTSDPRDAATSGNRNKVFTDYTQFLDPANGLRGARIGVARSLFGLQITPELYASSLAHERQIGGAQGIDAVLQQYNLDALVAETGAPAWTTDLIDGDHFQGASSSPAAIAGYPIINVPMG